MAVLTTAGRRKAADQAAFGLVDRLHSLLHTVRHIAHYEDELCTFLHEASGADSGKQTVAFSQDIAELLARMPGHEYGVELEGLRASLVIPVAAKKVASGRKRMPVAHKKLNGKGRRRS